MKINHINTFVTAITRIELNLNLKNMSNFCFDLEKTKEQNKLSNVGGFQSKNIDLNNKNIQPLLKEINTYINKTAKELYSFKNELIVSNIWANINRYKDFNLTHNHPFSILSGVFYAKVPKNSGDIAFINDFSIDEYIPDSLFNNFNNYNSKTWNLYSEENIMYIFPSWLKHVVGPNLSKEERISFSFNTTFKE
jgi:uncharacterized protein (TIGR02466 family)